MLTGIKLTTKSQDISSICDMLKSLENIPNGTYDLICDIERDGEAISYCNDRIMWIGWKLESNGIHVKWFEC